MRLPSLLLATLLLAACQPADDPDPEVDVPPPEEVVSSADDLVGSWVLTEQDSAAPEQVYTVTFTTTGEYIILREGLTAERMRFQPADEGRIIVTDSLGAEVERYAYDVAGNALTLTDPVAGTEAEFERREDLLDTRDALTPEVPVDPAPDADQPPGVQAPAPTQ